MKLNLRTVVSGGVGIIATGIIQAGTVGRGNKKDDRVRGAGGVSRLVMGKATSSWRSPQQALSKGEL